MFTKFFENFQTQHFAALGTYISGLHKGVASGCHLPYPGYQFQHLLAMVPLTGPNVLWIIKQVLKIGLITTHSISHFWLKKMIDTILMHRHLRTKFKNIFSEPKRPEILFWHWDNKLSFKEVSFSQFHWVVSNGITQMVLHISKGIQWVQHLTLVLWLQTIRQSSTVKIKRFICSEVYWAFEES